MGGERNGVGAYSRWALIRIKTVFFSTDSSTDVGP